MLGLAPALLFTFMGAHWIQSGQNFGRYQLALLPLLLFLGSVGAIAIVRTLARGREASAAWVASFALSAGYLAMNPAIAYSAKLGAWYGHIAYHWDYRQRWLEYMRGHPELEPPAMNEGSNGLQQGPNCGERVPTRPVANRVRAASGSERSFT